MALPRKRSQKGNNGRSKGKGRSNNNGLPWEGNQDTYSNSGGFFVDEGLDSGPSSGEEEPQTEPAQVESGDMGVPANPSPIASAVGGLNIPHPHRRRRVDPEDEDESPDGSEETSTNEEKNQDDTSDSDGSDNGSDDSGNESDETSGNDSEDADSDKGPDKDSSKNDGKSSEKDDDGDSDKEESKKKGDPNASSTDKTGKNRKNKDSNSGSNQPQSNGKKNKNDQKSGDSDKNESSSDNRKVSGGSGKNGSEGSSSGKKKGGGFGAGFKAGMSGHPQAVAAAAAAKKKASGGHSGSGAASPGTGATSRKASSGAGATGRKASGRASGGTGATGRSASAGGRGGIGNAIAGAGARLGNFAGRKLGNLLGSGLEHGINLLAKGISTAVRAGKAILRGIGHFVAFLKALFTPPGLIFTVIAFCVVLDIIFSITFVQTFGPSDIDCSKVEQQTKEVLNNGNSGAAAHTVAAWVDAYGQAAFDAGKKYGIPYEAILAQSAWESGWNTSTLSKQYHNFFGIKAYKGWSGKTVNMATGEEVNGGNVTVQSDFIAPSSDAEGFEAYGQFIRGNSRYNQALQYPNDYHKYIEELKKAGYATDSSYVSKITGLADQFAKYIAENHKFPPSTDVVPDMPKPGAGDTSTPQGSTTDGTGKDPSVAVACTSESKNNEGVYGSAGEMKECDSENCDFSWMCSIGICKPGDPGNKGIYPHLEYGYQCVWYAWQRLSMIHGTKGWMWLVGNGGDIWAAAAGNPQWEVDLTPHPGDGISGHNAPFAGSTHVAVVEKVAQDPSGWKVYISEGNANGTASWNSYGTRWLTKSQLGVGNAGNDIHFFRNKNWAPLSTNS